MDLLLKHDQHGAKASDTLKLEIDSKSHPAWTGGKGRISMTQKVKLLVLKKDLKDLN